MDSAPFQDATLNGASVLPTTEVRMIVTLI